MRLRRRAMLIGAIGVAAFLFLCVGMSHADGKKYKIGDTISDFSLKDDKGRTVKLSDYRGKVIVLNFYASW